MKSRKFAEVLLFVSGLGLSLITNLFTGDDEVLNFYQANRKQVLIIGIGLTILSIYLAFESQSQESTADNTNKKSKFKFLSTIFISGIFCLVGGLISSLILLWIVKYFGASDSMSLQIVSALVGFGIGTRFRYIYGDGASGAILGAVIGYAVSFYFSPNIEVDFLPVFLGKPPILAAGIIAGVIGLFTAIFEEDFNKIFSASKERTKKQEKEKGEILEAQLEQYDLAVAVLKDKGFVVYSSDLMGSLMVLAENARATEKKEKDGKTVREELDEAKRKMDSDPQIAIYKTIYKLVFGSKKAELPKPPYRVFNKHGEEIHKFTSINAFYKFATTL